MPSIRLNQEIAGIVVLISAFILSLWGIPLRWLPIVWCILPSGEAAWYVCVCALCALCFGWLRFPYPVQSRNAARIVARWSILGTLVGLTSSAAGALMIESHMYIELTNYAAQLPKLGWRPDFSSEIVIDTQVWLIHAVLIGPFLEEIIFRGFLWRCLDRINDHVYGTIFVSSAAFTMIHGFSHLPLWPLLIITGLVYGFMRHRSGSILPSIVAHATHNMLNHIW